MAVRYGQSYFSTTAVSTGDTLTHTRCRRSTRITFGRFPRTLGQVHSYPSEYSLQPLRLQALVAPPRKRATSVPSASRPSNALPGVKTPLLLDVLPQAR